MAALAPAAAGAATAGYGATALPFYPAGTGPALAALAAALAFVSPRSTLALALAVPVFPLGNLSAGLALLYAGFALAWLALSWRAPRSGLFFCLGPLLAPLQALALLPLAAQVVPGRARRAAQTLAAVLAAHATAALAGHDAPFLAAAVPPVDLAGLESPRAVARELWQVVAAQPTPARAALVLAAASVALPAVRERGPWPLAAFGAALLALTLLPNPDARALPLACGVWAACLAAAFWNERRSLSRPRRELAIAGGRAAESGS